MLNIWNCAMVKVLKQDMLTTGATLTGTTNRCLLGNPFNGYHIGLKEFVDSPMEVWFTNILLGKINPDNWLVEPEFNNEKVVFKS